MPKIGQNFKKTKTVLETVKQKECKNKNHPIVTELKNSNCDKTQIVMKLKNSNCDSSSSNSDIFFL